MAMEKQREWINYSLGVKFKSQDLWGTMNGFVPTNTNGKEEGVMVKKNTTVAKALESTKAKYKNPKKPAFAKKAIEKKVKKVKKVNAGPSMDSLTEIVSKIDIQLNSLLSCMASGNTDCEEIKKIQGVK